MNTAAYPITGGDYTGGGAASKQLKEILKKIGVDAKTLRRTMVAAYEAEMNTVIHARRGVMKVAVDAGQVDVSVEDEGPGIPDIEWAMREGHSTAPAAAREIGFGAGMGLPNIKRNSDRFSIQSAIGRGTQLRFSIFLKPEASSPAGRHSVRIEPERCQQCLRCLPVCPTQAIRVRGGRPHVLDHLCVDCTACGEVCEAGALGVGGLREIPEADADTVLVIPPSFLVQFGQAIGPEKVIDALREKGFNRIRLLDEWEEALRLAVQWYAAETGAGRPTISPVCPAVVNLIQVRYPSLLGYLAPFATPIEAAREALTVAHAVFVVVCPAQHTVLQTPAVLTKVESVSAAALVDAMFPRMKRSPSMASGSSEDPPAGARVYGMRHVVKTLDAIENGLLNDFSVIEMYACPEGCFGAPVWREDAYVAARRYAGAARWRRLFVEALGEDASANALQLVEPVEARTGVRLDPDMRKAIEKLRRIDVLTKALPGRNCGVCGAPTCAALAEDVVLGRVRLSACAYVNASLIELDRQGEDKP